MALTLADTVVCCVQDGWVSEDFMHTLFTYFIFHRITRTASNLKLVVRDKISRCWFSKLWECWLFQPLFLFVVQISICSRLILRLSRTYRANIIGSSTPSVVASWIGPTFRVFWIPTPRCCRKVSIFRNRLWAVGITIEQQWTYVVLGPIQIFVFLPCRFQTASSLLFPVCHSSAVPWVPDFGLPSRLAK